MHGVAGMLLCPVPKPLVPPQSALKLEDDVEEPPPGGRKERRRTDEGRRGWRSQGGSQDASADAQPLLGSSGTPKEPPAEDTLPVPTLSSPAE